MNTTFARSVDEAVAALAASVAAGAKPLVVGGGTLCVPALVRGGPAATDIVDLGRAGLDTLAGGPVVELGALVSYQQLITSPEVRAGLPMLHRMASGITGGIQIRHQGTLVGALCAARPQSDALAVLVALDAEVVVRSVAGTRIVRAGRFLTGPAAPDLAPDELVTGLRISLRPRGTAYIKHKFAESSWPVVTAAAAAGRVVLGGVAGTPQVVPVPAGAAVRAAVADHLAALPAEQRWADLRAPWEYRRRVAPEIAARAVELAEEAS
ncbi:FAD binding domain-containing protein [Pseudonocardia yuanmonensis]|uniref:FAD binding domain-containing protein n=1 Tax=Pseudonocardia yuanmonensis TaxID=1095914 RepID=A0ABP8XKW3_9PSEU